MFWIFSSRDLFSNQLALEAVQWTTISVILRLIRGITSCGVTGEANLPSNFVSLVTLGFSVGLGLVIGEANLPVSSANGVFKVGVVGVDEFFFEKKVLNLLKSKSAFKFGLQK